MDDFLNRWGNAAYTSAGFFWMAMWAFALGYIISSMIQVFVTESRMKKTMGRDNAKSVLFGTFFGFISSSCSFSALATSKSLFQKGASFSSSVAFLLASTNLVVELAIIISIFLGWQFVVGEYVGGILLILISWSLIRIIRPKKLIEQARRNLGEPDQVEHNGTSVWSKVRSPENWVKTGKQYVMEWKMVWKDVTIGFTIAGIVAAFVPDSFFQTLFVNTGQGQHDFSFFSLLQHVLIGPVAAFMTFIGSMGNIPLAALLFGKGVSFAGVMAFIFSDLVVFPVLRINARYYGWKMSLFILFLLFSSLVATSLVLHYGFDLLNLIPQASGRSIADQNHFEINYTLFFNVLFLAMSGVLVYLGFYKGKGVMYHKEMALKSPAFDKIIKWLAFVAYLWLAGGLLVKFMVV